MSASNHPQSLRTGWMFYLFIVAVFIVALLASGPLVATARTSLGASNHRSNVQVYFTHPAIINRGIPTNANIEITVNSATTKIIDWRASWPLSTTKSSELTGSLIAKAGRPTKFTVSVYAAQHASWVSVTLGGVRLPLRAWIR